MSNVIRVALPGFNALTNSDPKNFSLFSDQDNILIKEHSRGTVNGSTIVNHALGYFPHFYSYGEVSSGRFGIASGHNIFGNFISTVDADDLTLTETLPGDIEMRYFIFYDDIPEP